ncbi:MAG: FIVAR domain-containing protein [Clostridia bacterium]|nr:FIVAR domain-containing protein [Clostridia bacterium]
MKKYLKFALATVLVLAIITTSLCAVGLFASAQALAQDVSVKFTNADNDWVTLDSNNTIQDSALKLTIYNLGESDIILNSIENNGTSIRYTGWTNGAELAAGGITNFGISGTTNDEQVLKITISYYVKGNPTATAETCDAYIYCTSKPLYTTAFSEGYVPPSTRHMYGVKTTHELYPVSTHSLTYHDSHQDDKRMADNQIELYVDKSTYGTWEALNMSLDFSNIDDSAWYDIFTCRDHACFDYIHMTQTSTTGSMQVMSDLYGTSGTVQEFESQYNNDSEHPEGFFVQAGSNETTQIAFFGVVPDEAESTFVIELKGYGQTGGVFGSGWGADETADLTPSWTIKVYNNDKSALRNRLTEIAGYGLNQGSYKSGWNEFETALKQAYTVLGTNEVTAEQVADAKTELDNAYNSLVRYAVVITTQNFYTGTNNQNPVEITRSYEMQVTNQTSHPIEVLTNGTYPEYTYNRSTAVNSAFINAQASDNYVVYINQYYWYVDTSALEAAINTQATKPYKDEDDNDIYDATSWNNYVAAAAEATRVLNNRDLFQDDIDEATRNLNAAEAALIRLTPDVEWLTEGMQWADNIIENSFDDDFGYGWDKTALFASSYAQERYAALETAYNEAVEVTNTPGYTKAQADRVCAALWQAISNLRTVDSTTMGLLNEGNVRHADIDQYGWYKSLKDQHRESTGLRVVYNDILDNTSGSYQLQAEDFTAESWEQLQDALYGDFAEGKYACAETQESYPVNSAVGELNVPAYSMINNIWFLASQADYNACRDNLLAKVNHLEWIVDSSALEAICAQADAIDVALYTGNSAAPFLDIKEFADAKLTKLSDPQLYGDPDAVTNDVIAETVQELQAAIDNLVLRPKLTPNTPSVQFEAGTDTTIYGETIGNTVEDALAHLDIINDSDYAILKVYSATDREAALNDALGTGFTVKLMGTDGEVYETHTFVVMGDVDGNGLRTAQDFESIFTFAFEDNNLSGVYLEAADLNGDKTVDLSDAVLLQMALES